jgi:hypothetical protein
MLAKVEIRTRNLAIPRVFSKPAAEARNPLDRSPARVLAQIPDFRASSRPETPVGEILLLVTCKMDKVGCKRQEMTP